MEWILYSENSKPDYYRPAFITIRNTYDIFRNVNPWYQVKSVQRITDVYIREKTKNPNASGDGWAINESCEVFNLRKDQTIVAWMYWPKPYAKEDDLMDGQ